MPGWYDTAAGNDRVVFAVVVALAAHLGLILGVGFNRAEREPAPASLEITLVQFRADAPVEDAEFLAEVDQEGSGEHALESRLATRVASELDAALIRDIEHPAMPPESAAKAETAVLEATRSPADRSNDETSASPAAEPAPSPPTPPALRESDEIDSLIARLEEQSLAYAHRPRVLRLTSVSARAASDAAYLLAWTERIETVGNRNYPAEARKRRLRGDLRLLVTVRPDGSVREVRMLQSSGNRLLDDAAVRIVHLATPFEPFPAELRGRADLLEIIRTWQFRANRLSAGR